jgi:hypothetical protein
MLKHTTGKPAAAAAFAREALALVRGEGRAEAAVLLLLGAVGTAESDAMDSPP